MLLWLANIFSALSPQTRLFGLRRLLFVAAGVKISSSAKVCGTARVHYSNLIIGEGTWLGAGCHVIPTRDAVVTIGENCDIGPQVMFVTGSHEFGTSNRRAGNGTSSPIYIGKGSWVGARATFIAGAEVGEGCMVAAGSLVTKSFPDNCLIAGAPAKILRIFSNDDE